jgi:hypothetical protein
MGAFARYGLTVARAVLPKRMARLFWNVDLAALDPDRDADMVIARVVEHGTHADVQWMLRRYGLERVHAFFRDVGSAEVSDRTVAFWRAVLRAPEERWPRPPAWRKNSSAPWID